MGLSSAGHVLLKQTPLQHGQLQQPLIVLWGLQCWCWPVLSLCSGGHERALVLHRRLVPPPGQMWTSADCQTPPLARWWWPLPDGSVNQQGCFITIKWYITGYTVENPSWSKQLPWNNFHATVYCTDTLLESNDLGFPVTMPYFL